MLKEVVKYKDFDGNPQEETLHFNITKSELVQQLDLLDELKAMKIDIFDGDKRELNTPEKKRILELVKTIMRLAYGVRSADGRQFRKIDPLTEQPLWNDFVSTAVYDEFLFSLFTVEEKALNFVVAIVPEESRVEAEAAARAQTESDIMTQSSDSVELMSTTAPAEDTVTEDKRPQWLIEGRVPSDAELVGASREELLEAFRLKSQQS